MSGSNLAQRGESFGYDRGTPWADEAFSLVFSVPRVYRPLLDAWDRRFPGTKRAVDKLTSMGFLAHQPALVVDVRTREAKSRLGRPAARLRATAAGRRLAAAAAEDPRVLHDRFPRLTPQAAPKVQAFLTAFVLEPPHSRIGISTAHAAHLSGLPDRSSRWWAQHMLEEGLLAQLPERVPDVLEIAPEHWRVTRPLARQLQHVAKAHPSSPLAVNIATYRLSRTRFLDDIDPARIGITGTTDFDHDIECQRVLGALLSSPVCVAGGVFNVEPRIALPVDQSKQPWVFASDGTSQAFYQPDAELRERMLGGSAMRRAVVEYERFQSRRDAWSHIERFLGWLHLMALPEEPAVLRFVVDSEARVRSYVGLIEAFADYTLDSPGCLPRNPVMLAVSSVSRVLRAQDPLEDSTWFRIALPGRADTEPRPVLHGPQSPYDEYFGR